MLYEKSRNNHLKICKVYIGKTLEKVCDDVIDFLFIGPVNNLNFWVLYMHRTDTHTHTITHTHTHRHCFGTMSYCDSEGMWLFPSSHLGSRPIGCLCCLKYSGRHQTLDYSMQSIHVSPLSYFPCPCIFNDEQESPVQPSFQTETSGHLFELSHGCTVWCHGIRDPWCRMALEAKGWIKRENNMGESSRRIHRWVGSSKSVVWVLSCQTWQKGVTVTEEAFVHVGLGV